MYSNSKPFGAKAITSCGTFYLRSYFSSARFCFSAGAYITTNYLAPKARPSGLVLCCAFWPQSRRIELTATLECPPLAHSEHTFRTAHVCFWPKADIGYCTPHVRFWG